VISEGLEFQGKEGLEFLLTVGAESIEVGVDGGTEGRKVLEVLVLERLLFEVFPEALDEVEIGRIGG